ncbi:MAG: helix-turn-helix domain-containing protein [Cyanobacteriota bacterium]
MYTCDKVVEVLENIGVSQKQIEKWERYFGLNIAHDKNGRKFYNENHIKTFKAIKKNIALGYSLTEIREKLDLGVKIIPESSKNQAIKPSANPMKEENKKISPLSTTPKDNLYLIMLLERVMDEKEQFIKDKEYLLEQVHILEMQKQELRKASLEYVDKISEHMNQIQVLEEQLETSVAEIAGEKFVDSWVGKAKLLKVIFDTIGVDIPKERNKSFKVTDSPKRLYGNMAVFMSSFTCEDDPLWERIETYRVAYINNEELKGELDVEYYVDSVPVAKAIYSINCIRKPKKAEEKEDKTEKN